MDANSIWLTKFEKVGLEIIITSFTFKVNFNLRKGNFQNNLKFYVLKFVLI